LGWMTWVGQTQPSSKGFAFSLLAFVFIMAMIIYKWPKTGFRIALFVFIINTLIVVLYQPENIIGGIIGLYIFLFFLYPAYQIEKTIKSKNTDVEDDNKTTKLKDKKTSYIFCQNCGKKNVNEANYCKKCGNKIIK
jgi:ribosomal protein L40E